ncbi:MAG: hypothetical protein HC919_12155 [Oscillatoriales cyanobacterium SM2_2_1]|nr:hypothetical protein [Oscillatoriales cyanobacterium SM2_2_1]
MTAATLWLMLQAMVATLPVGLLPMALLAAWILVRGIWLWASALGRDPLTRSFAILSLFLLIGCFWAERPLDSLLGMANLIPYFALFLVVRHLLGGGGALEQKLWRLAKVWAIAAIPVMGLGLVQYHLGWLQRIHWVMGVSTLALPETVDRLTSTFFHANNLACYLLVTLTMTVAILGRSRFKVPWMASLLLHGYCLYLTNSRSGWIGAIIIALAWLVYYRWWLLVAALLLPVVVSLMAAFAPLPIATPLRQVVPLVIWGRLNDQLFPQRPIADTRLFQWQFAITRIQDRPVTGWGFQIYSDLYYEATQYRLGHPHNLALTLGFAVGIPLTLAVFVLLGSILWRGVRCWQDLPYLSSQKTVGLAYLTALGSYHLYNLTDVTLYETRLNVLGWVLLGAITSFRAWGHPTERDSRADCVAGNEMSPLHH